MIADYWMGLLGGLMIGSAAALLLLGNGRIMGASGILGSVVDGTALGFNAHGGVGCISVTANVAPKLCAEFQQATLAGEATAESEVNPAAINTGPNHWYGLAAAATPWYASAAFQLSLILFFVLVSLAALAAGLSPRSNLKLATYGRWPRLALAAAGLLTIILVAGVVNIIGYLAFADANNAGPNIPLSAILPLTALTSLGLAAGLIFFTVRRYREAGFRGLAWIVYGLVSAASAGFILFLAYWNILAPPM